MCKVKGLLKRTVVVISSMCILMSSMIGYAHENEGEIEEVICDEECEDGNCKEELGGSLDYRDESGNSDLGEYNNDDEKQEDILQTEDGLAQGEYLEFIDKTERYYTMYNRSAQYHWTLEDESLSYKLAESDEWVQYKDGVSCYKTWMNLVMYATNDHEIHYMNNDTSHDTILYRGTERVTDISGNTEYIMFVENTYPKRLHIQSGIIDVGPQTNNGDGMFIFDNHTVCWSERGDRIEDDELGYIYETIFLYYNFDERKYVSASELGCDGDVYMSTCSSGYYGEGRTLGISEGIQSVRYARRRLTSDEWIYAPDPGDPAAPLDAYGPGSRFLIEYDGGTECMGFANYLYRFHCYKSKHRDEDKEIYDRNLTVAEWKSFPLYSFIRHASAGGGHSCMIWKIEDDQTGVVMYEANTDGQCGVYQHFISYEDLSAIRVIYTCYPKQARTRTVNYDNVKHWTECVDCKTRFEQKSHNIVITNQNANSHTHFCADCGYSKDESHSFGTFSTDANKHWKTCGVCGYVSTGAHTAGSKQNAGNGTHYTACTVCGKILSSSSHTYSYSSVDANNHRGTCSCGATTTSAHNMRTGEASATAHQIKCSVCSYSSSETHSFSVSQNNASTHKKTCSKCGYVLTAAHSLTYPNASASSHAFRCTVCGYSGVANHAAKTTTKTKVATASVCTRTVIKCACGYTISTSTDYSHRYSGKTCLDCGYRK